MDPLTGPAAVDSRRMRRAIPAPLSLALFFVLGGCSDDEAAENCHGVCGKGTRCEEGMCVVAERQQADRAALAQERGERRARGRGREGKRGDAAIAPARGRGRGVDGRAIPQYDPTATRELDPAAGSERLDDAVVRSHFQRLEPAFDRCIAGAIADGAAVPSGSVKFKLGIAASGEVIGVSARAPADLDAAVVPCLRKAVFDHRFPKFDGPTMDVDYAFEIG